MRLGKIIIFCFLLFGIRLSQAQNLEGESFETDRGKLVVRPILHGTLALEWEGKIIIIDPYGGEDAMKGIPKPDLILITDIHGDHHNPSTLEIIHTPNTHYIVPEAVAEKMSNEVQVLQNGSETEFKGIIIKAIPMYNLPENAESRHTKGRGNGYILTFGDARVYISGDTEDIPEMLGLKDIDIAFVCMNLPYTMSVDQAAKAVLQFKPSTVFPYHYRGSEGLGDVLKFQSLVKAGNKDIDVRLAEWYPAN